MYQPVPPHTDPSPPNTNQYHLVLTQYYHVSTSSASYWPSTIIYQPVPTNWVPTSSPHTDPISPRTNQLGPYWLSTTKFNQYRLLLTKYHHISYSNVRLSFVDLRWAQLYVSLVILPFVTWSDMDSNWSDMGSNWSTSSAITNTTWNRVLPIPSRLGGNHTLFPVQCAVCKMLKDNMKQGAAHFESNYTFHRHHDGVGLSGKCVPCKCSGCQLIAVLYFILRILKENLIIWVNCVFLQNYSDKIW